MKALILAAGFGTRMRPVTHYIAKPAMWFFDRPVLAWTIGLIAQAGIQEIYVNLHHRAWSIRRNLRRCVPEHVKIHFLFEPDILGTAGALNPIRTKIGTDRIVMMNGDVVMQIDLTDVIKSHEKSSSLATLVLHPPSQSKGYPAVGAGKSMNLIRLPYGSSQFNPYDWAGTFTGLQIMDPEIFRYIPLKGASGITSDVYTQVLENGHSLGTYRFEGYWNDIGTPESYFSAHFDYLKRRFTLPGDESIRSCCQEEGIYISKSARCGRGCQFKSVAVISDKVRVEPYVSLQDSIVWPGIHLAEGLTIRNQLIFKQNQQISMGVTS